MIIYRPHRGGLLESMAEAREFETWDELKAYLVKCYEDEELGKPFDVEDVVIGEVLGVPDHRIGWNDTRYVCITHYFNERYVLPYPIGHCATDYGSLERSKRMCKEFLVQK